MKPPTISIITRCKGRLNHLKETLPLFLMQNYLLTEIIVVNYNSPDGLHEWLVDNFETQIKVGRLIEVYVSEPHFHHSHSRNVGLNAASGDWVLFLDADCKPSIKLVKHIIDRIGFGPNIFSMAGMSSWTRVMMAKREDLIHLGGFMENLDGWGYEDLDMRDRLFMYGKEMFSFLPSLVSSLPHQDYDRHVYLKPPYNTIDKPDWTSRSRNINFVKSQEYIKHNGIIANKGKEWGTGGEILFTGKRWLDIAKEDLPKARKMLTPTTKGAYILKFKKGTNELLNEKELLEQGCPQSYLDETKRQKMLGEIEQIKISHDKDKTKQDHQITVREEDKDPIVEIPE